jgi:hypothetical protein
MQSLAINVGDGTPVEKVTVQELTEIGPFEPRAAPRIGLCPLASTILLFVFFRRQNVTPYIIGKHNTWLDP